MHKFLRRRSAVGAELRSARKMFELTTNHRYARVAAALTPLL